MSYTMNCPVCLHEHEFTTKKELLEAERRWRKEIRYEIKKAAQQSPAGQRTAIESRYYFRTMPDDEPPGTQNKKTRRR